jgi:phage terminase large subunit-like protein
VGLDLSSTTDLTAAVAVFPDSDGARFDVLAQFFVPADKMRERALRDRVPYDEWARDGMLQATPGPVVDYDYVRQALLQWATQYRVQMVAYDPWNATDLVQRLEKQDGLVCVPMRQGFGALSAPTKSLEKAILAQQLRHDGHPVLRWCVSNVAVESDAAGNLKPSKDKSTDRIDGVVALIMAVDLLDRNARQPVPDYGMTVIG